MSIGHAYSDILSTHEKDALNTACELLIDHGFDELSEIKDGHDVADTRVGMYLPQRYFHQYQEQKWEGSISIFIPSFFCF